jgi:probable HAF family extracellular repeat protein
MKSKAIKFITALIFVAALVMSPGMTGQQPQSTGHHHYKLIDLGTLGGPHSYGSVNGNGFSLLNNSGEVASYADLATPDPNAAFGCYDSDCFQAHASLWKDGVISDLGALPVNNNSAAGSINDRGWATGQSQSSVIDPVLGFPEFRAVLWKKGQIIDLGTLPGGAESLGIYVNNAGQVIGLSTISSAADPLSFFGPTHTFVWQNGEKLDIGTLGGTDTFAGASCSNPAPGVVVGGSSTSTISNPDTGLPTVDPFLWRNGKMVDLGTLGGTNGFAQCANNRLQIIGQSSVAANPAACNFPAAEPESAGPGCHAFFWENGVITDLGTLGGDNSEALWLNDAGVAVGSADLPGPSGNQAHDAVAWINGKIHDLGTVAGDACSRSRAINARGQVVGGSSDCHNFLHAFVWDGNAGMVDLNTVMAPGSGYQLTNAFNINDRGEILAKAAPLGFTPNDDADLGHLVLLVPCNPDSEDCSAILQRASLSGSHSPALSPNNPNPKARNNRAAIANWRSLMGRQAEP